jgi:hypothetical protein
MIVESRYLQKKIDWRGELLSYLNLLKNREQQQQEQRCNFVSMIKYLIVNRNCIAF